MALDLVLREARPNDREILAGVRRASIQGVASPHYSHQEINAWLTPAPPGPSTAGRPGLQRFVAEYRDVVIGFSAWESGTGWVRAVYVLPEWSGKGAGSALLARIEVAARTQGTQTLRLYASLNAVDFYRNRGFVSEKEIALEMIDGTRMRSVRMVRNLDP